MVAPPLPANDNREEQTMIRKNPRYRLATCAGALAMLFGTTLPAQNLAGDWQGTLKAGTQELRLVLAVDKSGDGKWGATFGSIDQMPDWGARTPIDSITLQGSTLKFALAAARASYEGKLSADGATLQGTWSQGRAFPLEFRRATPSTAWKDPSPHTIQFVTVDNRADQPVHLEALDWGGSGRPLVLLAGLGNTAHVFDKLAPKLTAAYHVYGITRRGFGASSAPTASAAAYSADRLGDDVIAVLDALQISRPLLAGHSIAGEELSSVGSRHPDRVAGLIYLDAGYAYGYYDRSRGDLGVDVADLQRKLDQLQPGSGLEDPRHLIEELLATTLPGFERDLNVTLKDSADGNSAQAAAAQLPPISRAILAGMQKYTDIPVPVLAIYASPHATGQPYKDEAARAAAEAKDEASTGAQAKALQTGVPSARVVLLPHANHFVFLSNEADVLREINAFVGGLPNSRK
jgi:non-heme chloroperoxidase